MSLRTQLPPLWKENLSFKTQVIPSWEARGNSCYLHTLRLGHLWLAPFWVLSNDLTAFKPRLFCSLDNSQVEQTSLVQGVKLFFKSKTVFGSQEAKNAVKIIDTSEDRLRDKRQ